MGPATFLSDHLLCQSSLIFFWGGGCCAHPQANSCQRPSTTPDPWLILSRTQRGHCPTRLWAFSLHPVTCVPPPDTWHEKSLPLAQYQHGSRNSLRRRPCCQQGVWGQQPLSRWGREGGTCTSCPPTPPRARSLQLSLKLGCAAPSPVGSGASPPQKASGAFVPGFPRTSIGLPQRLSPRALRKPRGGQPPVPRASCSRSLPVWGFGACPRVSPTKPCRGAQVSVPVATYLGMHI